MGALCTAWGPRCFGSDHADLIAGRLAVIEESPADCGLAPSLADAQYDAGWDEAIVESTQIAYGSAGDEAQTPTIAVGSDPPRTDARAR